MQLRRLISLGLVVSVATVALAPRAHALDIASYVSSTGGGVLAIVGAVMMGKEDPDAAKRGKTFLIVGIAVSAGCSSVGLLLDLLVLGFSYDHVERLEVEVAAGGGPMIDAYAAGLGIPKTEVLAAVADTLRDVPVHDDADAARFAEKLRARLIPQARLTDADASRVAYALYMEGQSPVGSPTPWHDTLATLTGVSVADLRPTIREALAAEFEGKSQPGVLLSARSVLSAAGGAPLDRVLDAITERHDDRIEARIAELAQRTATPH